MIWEEAWQEYVDRIRGLKRGELAILKRNIGNLLEESRGCFGLAYRLMDGLPLGVTGCHGNTKDNILFMLASLCAYHPDEGAYGGIGAEFHALKEKMESDSLDKKLIALMDESVTQDPKSFFHRFSQIIRLMKSNEIKVDWPVLMAEVAQWDRQDRFIQKKWMRDYMKEVKTDDR